MSDDVEYIPAAQFNLMVMQKMFTAIETLKSERQSLQAMVFKLQERVTALENKHGTNQTN